MSDSSSDKVRGIVQRFSTLHSPARALRYPALRKTAVLPLDIGRQPALATYLR